MGYWPRRFRIRVCGSGGEKVGEGSSWEFGWRKGHSGLSQVRPGLVCRGFRAVVRGYDWGGEVEIGSNHVGWWRVGVSRGRRCGGGFEWRRVWMSLRISGGW